MLRVSLRSSSCVLPYTTSRCSALGACFLSSRGAGCSHVGMVTRTTTQAPTTPPTPQVLYFRHFSAWDHSAGNLNLTHRNGPSVTCASRAGRASSSTAASKRAVCDAELPYTTVAMTLASASSCRRSRAVRVATGCRQRLRESMMGALSVPADGRRAACQFAISEMCAIYSNPDATAKWVPRGATATSPTSDRAVMGRASAPPESATRSWIDAAC